MLGSLAAIALGVALFAGPRGAPTAVPAPEPTYELVATCKGPLLRRNIEQLVRRNDGKLFYKDDRGTLTAIADETNQSFNPARTSSPRDVAIDFAGGLTMVLVYYAVRKIRNKE